MKLLEKHFDLAFAAPDGIQKLRELILTLAMQGKLVPQDPKDQPASELLKAIEAKKQQLVKEGKIKHPKTLPEIKLEEIPYQLPNGWEWVRFFTVNIVKSELVSAKDYPLEKQIAPDSIEKGSGRLLGHRTVEESGARGPNNRFYKGQILYSKIRPSLNKAVIAPYNGLCSADMYPIETLVDASFMLKVILSEIFLEQVRQAENRVKMPKLNLDSLGIFQIPLPPLAEQRRIVAKIDRLMVRCDELEKLRGDRNQKRITIHTAALNRLLTAKESSDFSTAWRFITQHFGELYSVKENVAELRKAILQLAVMGKLVLQDPKDEPASELLEKVADERSRLLSKKEVREEKSLIPISDSEIKDLQIPNGWIAVHLGEVIYCLDYKRKPIKKDDRVKGEIPYYGANGRVGWIDEYIFNEPLVLVVEDETFIGRVLPFSYTIEGKSWVNNHAHVLKPTLALDIDFLNYSLSYYPFTKLTSGTTGRKKLNKTTLLNILYIFPPLAEQHRIVAKIDRLMALCDRLERQIDAATDKRTKLLKALMAQV